MGKIQKIKDFFLKLICKYFGHKWGRMGLVGIKEHFEEGIYFLESVNKRKCKRCGLIEYSSFRKNKK